MTTTKRPGLTPAMRRAITHPHSASQQTLKRAFGAGLIVRTCEPTTMVNRTVWVRSIEPTPRGHAALAAEPMTEGEWTMLERIANGLAPSEKPSASGYRVYCGLMHKRWILDDNHVTYAGRTQLRNIRAAMLGPWVPHSHSDATNTDEG